ncbi:peptidoglycan DD-metalloendopeptidase family protein [Psychroflexus montanilacus]|uniref:peptidoglycan DD-metalloendopeptidase family protein n=1 Tax=Psychroflexus montanilacus TaxID=2873598 RepID=UPI001CCA131F|nr:peptidoglycan DD-metalloendopeptidase family protein [Psychroflexus montanilacus]MBZ9652052.1 peptidoglycan DD-metalloendopeptidase family protein [Psychroflexus montanilacus]
MLYFMLNLLKDHFNSRFFSILGPAYSESDYVPLDLSHQATSEMALDLSTEFALQDYLEIYLKERQAKAAFGGYLEKRSLYDRSSYFGDSSHSHKRNIHLGLDVWAPAETPVYSPLAGKIHSQQDNLNYGDYGPTIILEHELKGGKFYTLYGHLSRESLYSYKVGEEILLNQPLALLGTNEVNGNYAPHLHFQLIMDLGDKAGDYPGVSSETDLEFYKNNCPDPNLLLNFKS